MAYLINMAQVCRTDIPTDNALEHLPLTDFWRAGFLGKLKALLVYFLGGLIESFMRKNYN